MHRESCERIFRILSARVVATFSAFRIDKKNFERAQLALKVLVEIKGIDDSFPRESPCCNAFLRMSCNGKCCEII